MICLPEASEHRLRQLKAIASDVRLTVLEWLKDPRTNFPNQKTEDPAKIGVCVTLIAAKAEISQPTASRHLEILKNSDFVKIRKIHSWSFYSRNEDAIKEFSRWLSINV
ncbi:ArsR family transcriptional regulator [Breoghania corrubedonensis]|uniref:ArsR family transcriptional regulator n=2 Tax=Breoghania corrubedonensis TaxID=665038 RepID=A0A2T5V8Y3_9HYPH|nr:ArsR family transcriptional regulator [Breoghania corrubedonensis]